MNPYDFVRLMGAGPDRRPVKGHQKFEGLSGRITCRLTVRTPLFIPRYRAGSADRSRVHETLEMYRDKRGTPLIPGTSLKGVIRNVAEAAGSGCFTLPNRLIYERQTVEYALPTGFHTCSDVQRLCPTCRLFGMLNKGTVFAGNVTVEDAHALPGWKTQRFTLAILDAPKPRHKPFYSREPNRRDTPIRGRKFYFHRPQGVVERNQKDGHNKTVEAVLPGAVFEFDVEYANLAADDVQLLLFALTLWEDTCHKVGMGKPIGLGSAKIEVVGVRQLDRAARYHQLDGGWSTLTDEAARQFVADQTAGYRQKTADNLADLHRIWRWDEHAPDTIRYPGREWFDEDDNKDLLLEGAP